MSAENKRPSEGSCIISEDVIASIASTAALEVAGVAGMATRTADIRGIIGAGSGRAVKVQNSENVTVVDVYVNLKPGAKIPEVGAEIQRNVKISVQSMTGKPVNKVNVFIAGLELEEAQA